MVTKTDAMRIEVEFSGWIVGEPEDYRFQATEEGLKPIITGVEYCAMSEEQRGNYIIEDLAKQIDKSFDSNWEDITVCIINGQEKYQSI